MARSSDAYGSERFMPGTVPGTRFEVVNIAYFSISSDRSDRSEQIREAYVKWHLMLDG